MKLDGDALPLDGQCLASAEKHGKPDRAREGAAGWNDVAVLLGRDAEKGVGGWSLEAPSA